MASSNKTPDSSPSTPQVKSSNSYSTTSTEPLFQRVRKAGGSERCFIDVPNALSRNQGTSCWNYMNMQAIKELVSDLNDKGVGPNEIVILCFYAAQISLLQQHIQNGGDGARGVKEICTVDGFAGRSSAIAIVDLVVAVSVDSYDLERYRTPATAWMCPKPPPFMRDSGRIATAHTRGNDGLFFVGQYALLVSCVFGNGRQGNPLFCLAEDLWNEGEIVSRDCFVDTNSLPASDAFGPRNDAMVGRLKVKRDAFVRQKIIDGRQRLGIIR
ncbi:MAG: hypothetical protein Q9215_006740 [Flavoplaca cf. flavocitrina]